jgi:hypothetical protein
MALTTGARRGELLSRCGRNDASPVTLSNIEA